MNRLIADEIFGRADHPEVDEDKLWAEVANLPVSTVSRINLGAALWLRFHDGLTYQAIGEQYGVSRERVRQQIEKGLRMMRHPKRRLLYASG